MQNVTQGAETTCGFIALIGAPNAGKSTLLNALVGQKIAIVSHKVQTTRTRLTGIAIEGQSQLVFVDTPGIFAPKRRLDRAMVAAAWEGAQDADQVVFLIDAAKGIRADEQKIIDGLSEAGRKVIVALNKVDSVKRDRLLALAQAVDAAGVAAEIFMISALTGDGVQDLKTHLAKNLPKSPWLYPEDQITDITTRVLAAEITREKIFLRLHQELPYGITVETEKWEGRKDGSIEIHQVIHVSRDGHKGIVIGKGGQTLKAIGETARLDMETMMGQRVHLFLFVRVTERWAEDREHYLAMGLNYVD
ncbi:GTPase Era [Iodidimonas muriae]|uniref:GTPase Era n=1 Tax=Iodidimonas muriae TaxID=261467 RepID=A0ABQ2L773_9PROT|nr:GTPase Era [Iodidimonas muriae]GER06366.1 GTPase Era [Kordiimonadales bacterium JCM 17843]GGO04491.1 GTPase Era [Iodidimonas muriae]